MKEQYCEWCGSVLLENGRCPVEECVQNVIFGCTRRCGKRI